MSSTSPVAPAVATYSIEPAHSSAHFKVRHLMISNVRGEFSKVSGTVTTDPSNLETASITAEIDVNSISTRVPDRDKDLKGADFLDAEHHPTITFKSKSVKADGPEGYKVTGDLTIRGNTREVVLDVIGPTPEVKDPWGYTRRGVEATTKINRKDFGVSFHSVLDTGVIMVGDEVEISLELELVRSA